MAGEQALPKTLFAYYGSGASIESGRQLPVTAEELEFYAAQETITIIPDFSLDRGGSLDFCTESYGPFVANMPLEVPLWLALMLHKRRKCRIQPPTWMDKDSLEGILNREKEAPQFFQPLPFYYIEISHLLFLEAGDSTFQEDLSQIRHLIESIRKVRYHKIESGLRKVPGAMIAIKLNNLSAAECNQIRLLFQGTLDHFHQLSKNDKTWTESSLTHSSLSLP